ncbi:MAG: hypothetical protein IJJ85_00675 [Clostridia bacterium]|nr:hypothetical protein [Clostridia bacterium]
MRTIYRILTPIFSLAVFPVLFFLPLFHIKISSTLSSSLVNMVGLKEYSSMYDMIKTFSGTEKNTLIKVLIDAFKDGDSKIGEMLTSKNYLYVFAVFFILALVFALLVFIFSLFTKKLLLAGAFNLAAIVSLIGMNMSFNAFAKPFLSGQISISSLLGSDLGVLSNLLGNVAKMQDLSLALAYHAGLFALVLALILCACAFMEKMYNR